MTTKVYVSAPYPLRDRAITVMHTLEAAGLEVTSRWLKAPDVLSDAFAREDLDDVARADVILALNPAEWADRGTGGRHVELGYALARGLPVLLVGARTNIFHYLSVVSVLDDADADRVDLIAHFLQCLVSLSHEPSEQH